MKANFFSSDNGGRRGNFLSFLQTKQKETHVFFISDSKLNHHMFIIPQESDFELASIVLVCAVCFFLFCQFMFWLKSREQPNSGSTRFVCFLFCDIYSPNYGITAYPIATWLSRFGITLAVFNLIFGFGFLPVCAEALCINWILRTLHFPRSV